MTSLAFVTPSYAPDLGRCTLLVESVRRFAPDIPHYLIVDKRDLPAFQPLAGPKTFVIAAEKVMKGFLRAPGNKGLWLSLRTPPVRGWVAQQIMKLSAPMVAKEDILICLDSDMTFIRPFTSAHVMEGDRIGLLDVDYAGDMVPRWTEVAEKLLGLAPGSVPQRGHVGNLIVWSRKHLLQLQERIEASTGLPWRVAVGRCLTFSEYILYGVFIRQVLGYDASEHAPSTRPLVRQPWQHDLSTDAGLESYINDFDPGNIAVMIHSKDGITAERLRSHFEAAWKAAS